MSSIAIRRNRLSGKANQGAVGYERDGVMPALATYPLTTLAASSDSVSMKTTLYALVVALHAEVDPEDDALVTAAVVHLINANRARFIGSRKRLAIVEA
jgi:hypothetical protein